MVRQSQNSNEFSWQRAFQQAMKRLIGSRAYGVGLTAALVLAWSVLGGWGLAHGVQASTPAEGVLMARVDLLPEQYVLGEQIFLRECATCHIAPSPAVMPTQSWARILVQADHYGARITPLQSPVLDIVWDYVQFTSRPAGSTDPVPMRLRESQFFRALHPGVEMLERPNLASCLACHPSAAEYNFRELSAEWNDAL